MKVFKIILLSIVISFVFQKARAQESADEKLKALLIYNMTKLINWPSQYDNGNFIIAVLGDAAITPELKKILGSKKHGNQTIEIREYPEVNYITKCHILYIPINNSKQLPLVMNALQDKSILIITEKVGLLENGSCINFIEKPDGRLGFELNKKQTTIRKLSVNNTLSDQLAFRVLE